MDLNNWSVSLDQTNDYSISKSDDGIVSIEYANQKIATVHLKDGQPIFVTADAIIKVDANENRIVICSPNDSIKRFKD